MKLKFNENKHLQELEEYIFGTYNEHYSQGKIQAFEHIAAEGHGTGFAVGNILKLASRFGKKGGYNKLDLLKICHYSILLMEIHDEQKDENDVEYEEENGIPEAVKKVSTR